MHRKSLEVTVFAFLAVLFSIGIVSAVNVAYVLEDASSLSPAIIDKFDEMELSYNIIRDSQIPSANFFEYDVVLVVENVNNAGRIPLQQVNSIFLNRKIAEKVWSVRGSGEIFPSPEVEVVLLESFVFENVNINANNEIRIYSGLLDGGIHYLNPPVQNSIVTVAIRDGGGFRPAIAYSLTENQGRMVKSLFFGAPNSNKWSADGKKIFENSMLWALSEVDQDNDGWGYSEDCDDENPLVNPGMTEIPYDGIDNDCDGSDLTDVDGDGYDAEIVGGEDCDDENPLINPDNPDPLLNCIDDVPIFAGSIPDFEIVEDMPLERAFDLQEHFFDPDSELEFEVFGNVNVDIVIDEEGVSFYPERDFNGVEEIYFQARDELSSVNSNVVTLTVLEAGEPPVFAELECETNILEDVTYICELNASDFEGNEFVFSIADEENLKCEISGNILTYSSVRDFNGEGFCEIKVSDIHGSDSATLEVSVAPVNDAPRILSFAPSSKLVRFIENTNNTFSIEVVDIDSGFEVLWFLNGVLKKTDSLRNSKFSFVGGQGNYLVEALVSDLEFTMSETWSAVFGSVGEFSCSEVGGRICRSSEICSADVLRTLDSGACCTASCVPAFKDADTCKILDDSLLVEIKKLGENNEKAKFGEKFRVEFEIDNGFDEDQDLDIEIHLYNLDSDESVSETNTNFEVSAGRKRASRVDLEIPDELDLDDRYAVFVKAEGDVCNQKFKNLEIERPEDKIVISDFNMPAAAFCGESVNLDVVIKNVGTDEQDVSLEVGSSSLGIDKRFDFRLEEFDGDDEKKEKIMFAVPYDAETGEYEINARAVYGSKSESASQSLKVQCRKTDVDEISFEPEESAIILNQRNIIENNTVGVSAEKKPNYIIITLILMFNFVLAASGGLLYLAWAKKH